MFSKKKLIAPALFLLLAPALAACGGTTATDTPVQATATTAAAVQPTNTTAAAAPTTASTPTEMAAASPTSGTAAAGTTPTVAMAGTSNTMYGVTDCSYGGEMKTIQAVDDHTVKFSLCSPDPAFPSKIAFSSLGIESAKHLQETGGGTPALLEHPLGTGPYMVQEWVRGDHLTLVANPNYWGTAPKMKTVIFKWNKEAAARLNSLKSGEADGMDNPDPNDFSSIQSDKSLTLYPREALNVFYLGMNNTKGPLSNEKVRQALAMGIDRAAIVKKFYPAGSTAADYFTPCAIPGGCEGDKWYGYDQAAAKKMLADAGYPNGFDIKLAYRDVVRSYLPTPGKVAEELQAQLKQLGINATIDVQESGTFLDNASKGNLDMFLLGWGADYPDQTDFLDVHFGKGANSSFGNKFSDLTDVLSKAASLADQTQRNALYAQANNLVKQHVPMIPVAHGGSATVYRSEVQGGQASPLGNESFAAVSVPNKDNFVWLQNAEPLSLYCSDETDGESLRACEQVFDPLLSYKIGGVEVEKNGLASDYSPNADLTEWTIKLRDAKFSDGTAVTAQDVVATYAAQWDAANPLHVGNTGNFDYWSSLFGAFLNPKPAK